MIYIQKNGKVSIRKELVMDRYDLEIGCGCLIFTALVIIGPILAIGFVIKMIIG